MEFRNKKRMKIAASKSALRSQTVRRLVRKSSKGLDMGVVPGFFPLVWPS